MNNPIAYIKDLKKLAKVSVIEYDKDGNIIGAVLDVDQDYVVDVIDDHEQIESTPYWEIDKIKLLWPSGLKDITHEKIYTDDMIKDRRTGYVYTVSFSNGSFWADPINSGHQGYVTELLSTVSYDSTIIGNINTMYRREYER